MWTTVCVSLSEILEVRGSTLTEKEAWALLYEIGRRLKNVPPAAAQNCVIVPENIQLHRNGGLSVTFSDKRHNEVFPHLVHFETKNVFLYSLGMSVLRCLQKDVPAGQYLDISEELHSVLSMMTSPKSSPEDLEKVIGGDRFKTQDWEDLACHCFKRMYHSIFGTSSTLAMKKWLDFDMLHDIVNESKQGQRPIKTLEPTSPKSMLHCKDSPILINLCTENSDFKKVSQVTVEYLDGRKLSVGMELDKISSGHLLRLTVPHVAPSVNPSAFCLTLLREGEHIITNPICKIRELLLLQSAKEDPHFYIRLRFMPQDINSIQESELLQAMYLQTRRDLLNGLLSCNTEEALLLAAYSLQCEVGNTSRSSKPFRMRDFVPVTIIDQHGSLYLRTRVSCLHGKLHGMGQDDSRLLYLHKAAELSDFGSHLMQIFMTRKCQNASSAWLSVGPKGMKIFNMHLQSRTTVQNFSWDQLQKIMHKNNLIILTTKTKAKLKLFSKRERRSKYIVRITGETHQYHRFDDFHASEQYCCLSETSNTTSHSTLPASHPDKDDEISKEAPESHSLRDTKPKKRFSPRSVDGSQTSLSSHNPQITPFEPAHQDCEVVAEVEKTFHSVNTDGSNLDPAPHEVISKDEVCETESDSLSSTKSENSVFDLSDVPPPICVASQDLLCNTLNASQKDEVPRNGNDILHNAGLLQPLNEELKLEHPRVVAYADSEGRQHSPREDAASRGEGDGISNLSGPDQQSDLSRSVRHSGKPRRAKDDTIPEAVSSTIADFEKFKKRKTRLKSATEARQ